MKSEDLGYSIELEDYVQQNNLSCMTFNPDTHGNRSGFATFYPDELRCQDKFI